MSRKNQISTFKRIEDFARLNPKRDQIGRPTLASPEIAQAIIANLSKGNYLRPSCEAAGISYEAVREWIQKAANDSAAGIQDSPYVNFTQAITRATAASETGLAARLEASEDWRAQAFLLERRHRERWGKTEQVQAPTQVLVLSEELASGMLEALRVALPKPAFVEAELVPIGDQNGDQAAQVADITGEPVDSESNAKDKVLDSAALSPATSTK